MKKKWKQFRQKIEKLWYQMDGKKTYASAFMLLTITLIKSITPDTIPAEFYETLKGILEVMLFGSASHGVYKTIKKK